MKVAKGLALFLFFAFLFGSCFNPPEFPVTPQIGLLAIEYWKKPKPNLENRDSLMIQIKFNDGDGDLGLPTADPNDENYTFESAPYNAANYFQTNSAGDLVPIPTHFVRIPFYNKTTKKVEPIAVEEFMLPSSSDQIVLFRTRQDNPLYSSLPDLGCTDYESRKQFVIEASDSLTLSPFTKIDTTVTLDDGKKYIVVTDTVYFTRNPNHYNIDITYLVLSGNQYVEFDLWERSCGTSNGRFPVLSERSAAIEGTLTYGIVNNLGFLRLFHDNLMKVRVVIRDRALNVSNPVETDPFTLSSIKKPGGG